MADELTNGARGPTAEDPGAGAGADRRGFIKQGLLASGALAFGGRRAAGRPRHKRSHHEAHRKPPNILVILVDQLRAPMWMPAHAPAQVVMPNLAGLARRSVRFERHYTASNDCSPARGVLLTGLYSHQTGVMLTGGSWLDPRFPTWGSLLRDWGYRTAYYGKWHLNPNPRASLQQYGFSGGTYPSPNGGPGQGTRVDPTIAHQFDEWFLGNAGDEPWCTTVSFVNPHDVAWWHRCTEKIRAESSPQRRAVALPPNFETPEQLLARGKPALQRSLQDTAARSFGKVPFEGPEALESFTNMMDTYLLLQSYVDVQIGRVLRRLQSRRAIARNTVVVFTSDHGEYAGSHGMRGKGASAYEEAIRVPLYVHDPRGIVAAKTDAPRLQLTSSADFVPLLLTIAAGSSGWREDRECAHLARRCDLAKIGADPRAAGRRWVVHATDEDVTEFASNPHAAAAPRHVVALRTAGAKLALYSNWLAGGMGYLPEGQEAELYDYSTEAGRLELANEVASSPLTDGLRALLEEEAIPHELRAPLPGRLRLAHKEGLADYRAVERFQAQRISRVQRGEEELTPEPL